MTSERAAAWSSSTAAAPYDRTRPDYPGDAVSWVLSAADHPVARVLDLGAGTGKLTGVLLGLGVEVVAVDPSSAMLDVLVSRHPEVQTRVGTGEALPVPDASVDAVVCGQAWHWVDPVRGVPEVARVLRPGGVLGVLWNLRDEQVPWVAALGDAMDDHEDAVSPTGRVAEALPLGPLFGEPELEVFAHAQRLAPSDLRELVLSRSHVLTREPADRERILARVDELARTHTDLAGRAEVVLPYSTVTWRARLA